MDSHGETGGKFPANDGQEITNYIIGYLMDATGRSRTYNAPTKLEKLEQKVNDSKFVMPAKLTIDPSHSIKTFPVGYKVDPDDPNYYRQTQITFLSKERAQDLVRPRPVRIKTRMSARVTEVDGVPVEPDPISESRRANESLIYTKAYGDNPTTGMAFVNTGKKGTVSTPSRGFGVGEDRFERKEDKRTDGFESKQDEDDNYSDSE